MNNVFNLIILCWIEISGRHDHDGGSWCPSISSLLPAVHQWYCTDRFCFGWSNIYAGYTEGHREHTVSAHLQGQSDSKKYGHQWLQHSHCLLHYQFKRSFVPKFEYVCPITHSIQKEEKNSLKEYCIEHKKLSESKWDDIFAWLLGPRPLNIIFCVSLFGHLRFSWKI